MATPGLIPAIGGVVSSAMNLFGASSNRKFQERMSSTAHQREVEDLRKAGLNPILSAFNKGASTPTGAMATFENPVKEWDSNVNTAKSVSLQGKALDNRTRLADADIVVKLATADNVKAQTELFRSQTGEINQAKIPLALSQIDLNNSHIARQMKEIEYLVGQINLLGTQQQKLEAETILAHAAAGREYTQSALNVKRGEYVDLEKLNLKLENILKQAQIPRAQNQAEVQRNLKDQPFGQFQPTIENWIRTLSPFR